MIDVCVTSLKVVPALSGLGTPPTKTVFLGSSGSDASRTKSASESLHGRIWTGLSLMVGEETQRYNLSSSCMHWSINDWTDDSSWEKKSGVYYRHSFIRKFNASLTFLSPNLSTQISQMLQLNLHLSVTCFKDNDNHSRAHLFNYSELRTMLSCFIYSMDNYKNKTLCLTELPERGGRHIPWVESKTCFQPCEANPRRGVRTVWSLPWSHLN